jgi:glutathione S-transferase
MQRAAPKGNAPDISMGASRSGRVADTKLQIEWVPPIVNGTVFRIATGTFLAITFYDLVDKDGRRYSPYGWRIRMALAHKGLHAAVELCWHSDKKKLGFSGQSLVPVLRDGERIVSDSWNIACYLDEAYPDRPMLMDGAQGRSFAKFINGWTDTIIGRPLVRSLYLDILKSLHPDADAHEFRRRREERNGATLEVLHANRTKDFDELNQAMTSLNELLRHQPFVAGSAPAYVDYIVFGTLQMPRRMNDVEPLSPQQDAVRRWRDAMRQLFNGLADNVSLQAQC